MKAGEPQPEREPEPVHATGVPGGSVGIASGDAAITTPAELDPSGRTSESRERTERPSGV